MINAFLDKTALLFSRRFLIAYWFPLLFAVLLALLSPLPLCNLGVFLQKLAEMRETAGFLSPELLIGFFFLVLTFLAYLFSATTRPLVQTWEGYTWPKRMRRWKTASHRRRWEAEKQKLRERRDGEERARAQQSLYAHYPPQAEQLLPTEIGNILRAAESYGESRYGLDLPFWWSRLWNCLPKTMQEAIEESLMQIIAYLNLSTLLILIALAEIVGLLGAMLTKALVWDVRAFIPPAALLLLSWFLYRGAVAYARIYGERIRVATDLYRFKLFEALHLPFPSTPLKEKQLWRRLTYWLYTADRGMARPLTYRHPQAE